MIERVALAFTGIHITTASGSVVDEVDVARAAIEAMREPTEEMIEAAHTRLAGEPEDGVPDVYRAMINEALKCK
tara:strand:+ start:878 stop:1099 length:222 start_codon:yes stop_codon:yes gene_type:complete